MEDRDTTEQTGTAIGQQGSPSNLKRLVMLFAEVIMKNDFCKLSENEIEKLPKRYRGFLASPFQHNERNGFVMVPSEEFGEMINIIAEAAIKESDESPAVKVELPEVLLLLKGANRLLNQRSLLRWGWSGPKNGTGDEMGYWVRGEWAGPTIEDAMRLAGLEA